MPTAENNTAYHGQDRLATLAGWSPKHRSLEAEAAEFGDLQERDTAARSTFARRGAR
jgi:hypothetical protein